MEKPTVFPVKITAKDYERNGECVLEEDIIFGKGKLSEFNSETFLFEVEGMLIEGFVVEDNSISHIPARLNDDKVDMRQMKVYLLEQPPININRFIYISYYLLKNGNRRIIFLLNRMREND